ncbi:hypothetical protein D9M69_733900 [compost metagenome]
MTARPTSEPTNAIQRTIGAWSTRPRASSTTPKKMGVQMARLSKPMMFFFLLFYLASQTKYVMNSSTPTIIISA